MLKDSPAAMSTGQVVNQQRRPHVWLPGSLPFYVTDPSRLKVICPLRYRLYADRIEENVPIFRETVRLGDHVTGDGGHRVKGIPGVPVAAEDAPGAEDVEVVSTIDT